MIQVAIDGPAGTGKSTVSKKVAEECNLLYIDTGAMYRAITLYELNHPKYSVKKILKNSKIKFNEFNEMVLNGINVEEQIRNQTVTDNVSRVSAIPEVRDYVTAKAKEFAISRDCLMDGRDIGTVVLPCADLKIYLDASPEVRARRRLLQKNLPESEFNHILKSINERDRKDSTRATAPLRKADDAILINTDHLSKEEVIDLIVNMVQDIA